ncbi:MAG TPA: hypothetical protein VL527_09040 [Dongiaceae bacterium]|nr:hypothetical protein [Dongiaceae bacterium]
MVLVLVLAVAFPFGKNKNPTAGLGSGVENSCELPSKPYRHAAQQQRVQQRQSKVQITIHGGNLVAEGGGVNFFYPASPAMIELPNPGGCLNVESCAGQFQGPVLPAGGRCGGPDLH